MEKQMALVRFRVIALIVLLAGAACSLGFVLYAGRNNKSFILPLLFVIWVLSPFIALVAADRASKLWAVASRSTIYWLMLLLTLASLIVYSGILNAPGVNRTPIFLFTPLISWVVIAIIVALSRSRSRRINNL